MARRARAAGAAHWHGSVSRRPRAGLAAVALLLVVGTVGGRGSARRRWRRAALWCRTRRAAAVRAGVGLGARRRVGHGIVLLLSRCAEAATGACASRRPARDTAELECAGICSRVEPELWRRSGAPAAVVLQVRCCVAAALARCGCDGALRFRGVARRRLSGGGGAF